MWDLISPGKFYFKLFIPVFRKQFKPYIYDFPFILVEAIVNVLIIA